MKTTLKYNFKDLPDIRRVCQEAIASNNWPAAILITTEAPDDYHGGALLLISRKVLGGFTTSDLVRVRAEALSPSWGTNFVRGEEASRSLVFSTSNCYNEHYFEGYRGKILAKKKIATTLAELDKALAFQRKKNIRVSYIEPGE
jgi:hypothetical protein